MQQSLKQISFTMLFGLLITFISGFNTLIANENDTIPPTRTDSTAVIRTDTVITHFQSCDSLYLAATDSTYFTSTTVDMGHLITRFYTYSEDSLSILDSTVTDTLRLFVLTIHPSYDLFDTLDITLCEHEMPYVFNEDTVYAAGSYDFHLKTIHGCDSCLKTVNLSVTPAPRDTVNVTICGNEFPFEFDSLHHFDAPGIYDIIRDDSLVCHQITTLNLYSLPAYADTLYREICDLDSGYFFADSLFTESTVHTIYDTTALGCDSLTTLVLDIHHSYTDTVRLEDQYICRYNLPFLYGDSTFTETGDYEIHTHTSHGCDSSTVFFHLQVLENEIDTLNLTLCSSEFPFVYDSLHVFDSIGTYTFLHTVDNLQCPDVTTLHLSSKPSYNDTTVITICSTETPYIFADSSFTESTVYTHYDSTALGCDSLSTLALTVHPAYPGVDTMDISVCTIDMPFVYNGDTLTEPGRYDFHLMTESGCDSTDVTILFSVFETPYDTVSLDICHNNFPFMYYETQIDSAGAYDLRILDSVLCDTMRHLIVNELPIYHDSISVTVCANEPYVIGDSTITVPGIYDIMLQTEAGCDSLITLTLEHYPIYEDSLQSFTICENDLPFVYDGNSYFESDTVVLQYQTINGCDSIVSFALTVLPIIYNTDTLQQEICQSQLPYTAFDSVLTAAGTYTYIVPSAITGCDSVFYLTLIVHDNPAPTITGNDYICEGSNINLMVEPIGQQYLWNNGNVNQMLNITAGGNYTVTVTNEFGCTGTATKQVEMAVLPNLHVSGTPTICYGDSSILTVSGADHYLWETGSNSPTITVHPTTTTNYKVTAYSALSCAITGSYTVIVNTLPTPVITGIDAVCAGDSTQFTAAGGIQYQWSNQLTGNRITVSQEGLYTVTVTDANGCRNTTSKSLTVNSRPALRINGRTLFCQGNTTTISASGAATYEWSSGEQTSSISTPYAGTYTVTGTAANGCTATASTVLTTTQIQATITGVRHFCQGESTTLTVSGNETYTYRWYDGSTTSSIAVSAAGTYSVEITNALGCTNTISTTVTEYALPTPMITGNTSICQGRSTTLRASGGNQYVWDDGSTQAFITVNTTGTYAVTVTNQSGCSASTTHTVIVNPLPEINILTNNNICGGESVNITAHAPTAVTYDWTTGQHTSLISVQPSSTTTYTVLVTDDNNCTNTSSATITVNQRPDPYINGERSICQGSSTTLTAYGGSSYRWSNGQTTQEITVTTGGTYTVTVSSAASSACTATTQTSVTLHPLPVAAITENSDICQGQTANLEVTASNCTYNWSNGGRSSSINVRNAGTYTVTVTNTNTGCTSTLSSVLTVNPLPVVTISGNNVICAGRSTTLTASSTESCSYNWSNGSNNALNTVSAAGTYTVTATNTYQCTSTASVAVTVNALPTPAISGNDIICPNGTSTLTVTPAAEYAWSTGEDTRSIVINPSATSVYSVTVTDANGCQGNATSTVNISEVPNFLITGSPSICAGQSTQLTATGNYNYHWSNDSHSNTITVSTGGTYTVTATNAQGCQTIRSFNLTVNALPVVAISGNEEICAGQTTTLTATSGTSCTYRWNNGLQNATCSVSEANTYTVTATDQNQCEGTASVTISVNALPVPVIIGNTHICPDSTTTLSVGKFSSYRWSNNETTQSINVSPAGNTSYSVVVTDTHGCQGNANVTVELNSVPVFNITGINAICAEESTTLAAVGSNDYEYHWSTGSNTNSITVSNADTYTVTATNGQGCQSTRSFALAVNALPTVHISGVTAICGGASTQLTANSSDECNYLWNNGTHNATIEVSQAGTYRVTATNANQCTSEATIDVSVNAIPRPVISGNNVICPGQNTTLTATPAATYHWSTGDSTNSITVSPNANITYRLTVTDASGCQGDTSFFITVGATPDFSINGPNSVCTGQPATLTALANDGNSYSYRWSSNANNAATATVNVSETGQYSVTATNASGCQHTHTFNFTVNALPEVSINGGTTFCSGSSTMLTASGDSGCTYVWNNEVNNANTEVTAGGLYTVTATNANHCTNTASVRVTMLPLPTPTISGRLNICPGTTTELNSTLASRYQWSTGDTTQSILVTPTTSGTYSLTVTDANGCQGSASQSVQLFAAPTVTINGNSSICAGETTTLTATAGFSYYRWSNENRSSAIEVSTPDNYSVTVTDQNGCSTSASKYLNVKPLPAINFMGSTAICQGNTASITAISSGNCSYQWSNGTTHSTATFNTAGTYSVTATMDGCRNSNSVTISIYDNPQVTITGNSIVCPGTSTQLTASDATHYHWSTGDTNKTISVIPQISDSYSVTVTDNHGCQGVQSKLVTLSEVPSLSISGSHTICAGETTTLTASGNYSYLWNTNATTADISVNLPGLYTVTATNSNGCTSSQSVELIINPLPVVTLSGSTSACNGSSATVTANGGSNCTYLWDDGFDGATREFTTSGARTVTATNQYGCTATGYAQITIYDLPAPVISGLSTICPASNSQLTVTNANAYRWSTGDSTQSVIVTPQTNATYHVTVTDEHGCEGSTSFAITICNPVTVSISGPAQFCTGETPTLSATPGYQYVWSTNDTSRSITIHTPGVYRVTATNQYGCTDIDSITVVERSLPNLTFGMQHSICEGQSYTYTLPADSNITYVWSNSASGPTITVTAAGIYQVTATNQYGCSITAADSLSVRPLPVPSITGSSTICQGENAILTAHGGTTYHWSNGSNTADIAVFPNTTTTYAVTATNEFGCSNSASKVINVNVLPSITFNGNHYFCEGETTTITVMGGSTYNWSTGDHTNSIHIGTTGTYRITVSNSLGCQRSDSIVITSHANPNVTVSGNNPLCNGQSELLTATGAASYLWSTGENSSNILVMPTATTTYTVTGTDSNGCHTIVSKVVSVEQLPDLHISGVTTICQGETVTMTATGAQTYHWNNGSNNSTLTVNQGGTYTVTGTSANGCQNSESITVTINPTPFATINGANTICQNSTILLTATGGDIYQWSNGASTDAITISAGGSYTVTASNTYGCSSTANITVAQLESPFLQIVGAPTTCSGSNLQLTAVSTGAYFNWSTGANTNIINVAPTSSQYYQVTVTNALGCSKSDSIYITVLPTYHDTISGSTCQGQPFSQYGFELPAQDEAGEFFHTRNLQSSFGCDSIVTLHLTVNPLPSIDTIAGAILVSNVGTQLYNVVNPQNTNVIEWRVSNTNWTLSNNNQNSVQLTISGAGTGTLIAKAINSCGFTEKSIFITCNVGVSDYEQDTRIRLYPNPVSSLLNIDLSETAHNIAQVQLYDNLGRCLQTIPVTDERMQLDCTSYADGIYYVRFINNEYQLLETRKIIIK